LNETTFNLKAVGEPPFMLSMSVWSALKDAIASVAVNNAIPKLDTPATPERVLWAVQKVQQVDQPELEVTVELNEQEK